MTNKEALKILKDISIDYGDASADQMDKIDEAMTKAIKALEREALIMENDIKSTDRCSNCSILPWEDEKKYCEKCSHLDQRLESLKTRGKEEAEWIDHDWEYMQKQGYRRCSRCHHAFKRFDVGVRKSDCPWIDGTHYQLQNCDSYCPHCGAYMINSNIEPESKIKIKKGGKT